jgi:hypothetical protein
MGHSFAYILFIGLAEVVGAWLLLWNRTKLLGLAILIPVMVNVLVFDLIFLDTHGATASATIYLLLLGIIAYCNQERVMEAIRALTPHRGPRHVTARQNVKVVGLALLLMAALFAFDQLLVNVLGHGDG